MGCKKKQWRMKMGEPVYTMDIQESEERRIGGERGKQESEVKARLHDGVSDPDAHGDDAAAAPGVAPGGGAVGAWRVETLQGHLA